ncbi:hypothetical protein PGRAN_09426 [Listeria grandensis FSL F6-0971]|uniref:Uncharacterized protein n=2 Tax=Listeria grandensis TaxID=1494963 RepID=W7BAT5_9LIST|nr:hypothetical protein PGRAN_09426 [Listeria grandensis FSL F6-0971]
MIFVMVVLCGVVGCGLGYFFGYRSKGLLRIRHLLDVKTAFAADGDGPKRLIVGGSDVLYSFDTDRIGEETGIRTVNFGLNVGLGMGFLLDVARENVKPGDEVVLCLAYSLYFKPSYDVFAYEYYRMFRKRELRRFSWRRQMYYLLGNFKLNMAYRQKQFELAESGAYVRVRGSELEACKNKPLVFPTQFTRTAAVRDLEQFCQWCADQDVVVRVTYTSTLRFDVYDESSYLRELQAYLTANYEVIGEPWDYLVPHEQIFNSVYHVNEAGQRARTELFLREVRGGEVGCPSVMRMS